MALTANANDFPEISGPLLKNMDGTELLEAIQQIDDADSYVALHECISTIPAKYGLTMINAWQGNLATWMPLDVPVDWELLCEEPVTMKNRKVHISLFLSKGLMDWKQDYLKNDYIKVDPVFWSTLFIDRPFFWDHRFRSEIVSNEQQQFMEVARDRGFHSGWVKPFHGRGMELGALAYFAAADRFDLEERLQFYGTQALDLFSYCFFEKLKKLFKADYPEEEKVKLTLREIECIRFSAVGKTSWEISQILGISERTINFHLTNAMHKLGVHNKSHAIAKFISNVDIWFNVK